MIRFKPEVKPLWEKSRNNILKFISGESSKEIISPDSVVGIETEAEAIKFLEDAIAWPEDEVALDSETTSLYHREGEVIGISISYKEDFGAYIDANCLTDRVLDLLQNLFNKKIIYFHNAKFDMGFFFYHFGWKFPRWEDSMLMHYLINETPGTHGLKQLAMEYTKYGDYEKAQNEWIAAYCKTHGILKEHFTFDLIPFEIIKAYAATDAIVTRILGKKFRPVIKRNDKFESVYQTIMKPGSLFLTAMQDNGVPFDMDRLIAAQKLMQSDIDEAIAEMYKDPIIKEFEQFQGKEFNPGSVMQLRALLFDFLHLPPTGKKTDTGKHSTDAEVLEQLSALHPVPGLILNIRKKSKIKNTYLDKIIPQLNRDGRLRTGFNLHSTTSGRLSSSGKLNMQQLPRDNPIVKGCIKAKPGYKIVSMDLTTAEMYVAACLSKDKALKQVFSSGQDVHSTIAKKVFNLPGPIENIKDLFKDKRQAAKSVTFGILYGAAATNISEQITSVTGKPCSVSEAAEIIDDYFTAFPQLRKWIDKNIESIKANGFTYSSFGRKRRLANVKSSDRGVVGHTVRSGLNFLVQSDSSDINLLGAIDMHNWIVNNNFPARIFALVHDSILAEVREDMVTEYCDKLRSFVQKDRGIHIPGSPIGCEFEVGDDYSFGKFEEKYAGLLRVY